MPDAARDAAIRTVLSRLDAAWRDKKLDGLEDCFDENAIIVGPTYTTQYAIGHGPQQESGTDQLVLSRFGDRWRVVFRYIYFATSRGL
jgi:hypothetical protein